MKSRKGQTLIEVIVAVMISAMTATAVFSVVISSQYSNVKADKREASAVALKAAAEYLKPFVCAVPNESSYVPNSGYLPGEGGVWALRPGTHNMDFIVANMPQLGGKNSAPSLSYLVSNEDCNTPIGNAPDYPGACKKVTFTLTFAAAEE